MRRAIGARPLRRRLLEWLEAARPSVPVPVHDSIGDNLRAAVAAEEKALNENVATYQARVESMIDDFFARYGERDAQVHR